ncbi:hypothetical protein CONCODRAFT_80266 [Conidiobolus coronatus NRRL 28638]|uniref:Uncharacterized protein n=1 Tax=Conidiobolus coronatus (strain ATCC 28846 / CBS 209.66 / NRRL 28638) TaxID=796925 RepID=A0A137NWV3_CONC2|nr:hypothetical protein CONCODRAFT_80266 [Conidiobolus coronatus NRRL 28638]|eukprot:KXN67151.1 hypothetical protein CONCODRAFT_80266 [Conidiobolus coronatus NRRL 28638]
MADTVVLTQITKRFPSVRFSHCSNLSLKRRASKLQITLPPSTETINQDLPSPTKLYELNSFKAFNENFQNQKRKSNTTTVSSAPSYSSTNDKESPPGYDYWVPPKTIQKRYIMKKGNFFSNSWYLTNDEGELCYRFYPTSNEQALLTTDRKLQIGRVYQPPVGDLTISLQIPSSKSIYKWVTLTPIDASSGNYNVSLCKRRISSSPSGKEAQPSTNATTANQIQTFSWNYDASRNGWILFDHLYFTHGRFCLTNSKDEFGSLEFLTNRLESQQVLYLTIALNIILYRHSNWLLGGKLLCRQSSIKSNSSSEMYL